MATYDKVLTAEEAGVAAEVEPTVGSTRKKLGFVLGAVTLAGALGAAAFYAGEAQGIALERSSIENVVSKVSEKKGPFYVDVDGGKCSGGSGYKCDAAGWVYCQDATCSEPKVKNGVLVSECLCWAPGNTNESTAPVAENAGASCVMNAQNPSLKLPAGGEQMCDAMKKGALVSTYGPKGWKPPLVFNKCPAKTQWAWCWGAPCEKKAGDIICDCPMMVSNNSRHQFLSISQTQCNLEDDPCSYVHNGSPNGKQDIQRPLFYVDPNKSCQPQKYNTKIDDVKSNLKKDEYFQVKVDGGKCSGGTSYTCDAPGWVYCQDAPCSEPVKKDGVWVSECLCWAPSNTNVSYAPVAENAGASCVINAQNPKSTLPAGGEQMCDAMKKGALVSTYGPKGWKPPLVFNKCPAKTPWAWCWGAPCKVKAGDIICDCPMMVSDNSHDQFLSISESQCELEKNPCNFIHNGSPNGKEDIQRPLFYVMPNKSCNKGKIVATAEKTLVKKD